MKNSKGKNNFNGTTNFYGTAQFAGRNIINNYLYPNNDMPNPVDKPTYDAEPVWRSPITLGILTWIGTIIAVLDVIFALRSFIRLLRGLKETTLGISSGYTHFSAIIGIILLFLFAVCLNLWMIAKKQIRVPLVFNYALNGCGKRLTIEKMELGKCPKCGGKMRYYNKAISWENIYQGNGKTRREVSKRIPAIACKRNPEHWFPVDPAEQKL